MNVEFCEQLKHQLRTHPREYNQTVFVQRSVCGTECCIAGHAYMLAKGVSGDALFALAPAMRAAIIGYHAQMAIGLDDEQADILFGLNCHWPRQFWFSQNADPETKVKLACAFIDYLLKGGDPEYYA